MIVIDTKNTKQA